LADYLRWIARKNQNALCFPCVGSLGAVERNCWRIELQTHLYGASRASTLLLIAFSNGLGQSKKMEPEHLYQWLICFFKTNSKSNWEKNELVDAIRDQYVELMKKVGELPPKKQPS